MADGIPILAAVSLRESTVMLGEPVLLDCRITNHSESVVAVALGELGLAQWVTVELLDPAGKRVPPTPDYRPKSRGGLVFARCNLKAGETHSEALVVSHRVSPPRPGKYRLSVTARVPYMVGRESVDFNEKEQLSTLVADWSLDLNVTKADAERLHQLADRLAARITGRRVADAVGKELKLPRKATVIQALFSMPEKHALPVWRSVVNDPDLHYPESEPVVDELLRIGSPAAANLLACMWDNKTGNGKWALFNLWWTGGPGIKKHIDGIFAARGEKMPEAKGPIVPMD